MLKKNRLVRNESSTRLGGLMTTHSFVAVPVIAHDRLRKDFGGYGVHEEKMRLGLSKRFGVA
jgi:hypothetical protein